MIWVAAKPTRVHATLNSLRHTASRPHFNVPSEDENKWKVIASCASFVTFVILLALTVIGIPAIATELKKRSNCLTFADINYSPPSTPPISSTTTSMTYNPSVRRRICPGNAIWNRTGVTVAGQNNGTCSTSLSSLNNPNDVYVFGNGTLYVSDYGNNRIVCWYSNSNVGVLVAGTGAYGSWSTLLARPAAVTIRGNQMFVSDVENYRVQVFPVNNNVSLPEGVTIIGRYGQGDGLNQINSIGSIVAPESNPMFLFLSDTRNHRVLLWSSIHQQMQVVAGRSGSPGLDSSRLFNPVGITLDERRFWLYIADRGNNRIQRYDLRNRDDPTTIAGFGLLNSPSGVILDTTGDYMFIADTLNHRILLWHVDEIQGRVLIGNGTAGVTPRRLNAPSNVRFDDNHNLYVVDTNNCRIQRFDLLSDGC